MSSCTDPENVQQGGQEQGREADPRGVETGPQQLGGAHINVSRVIITWSKRSVALQQPLTWLFIVCIYFYFYFNFYSILAFFTQYLAQGHNDHNIEYLASICPLKNRQCWLSDWCLANNVLSGSSLSELQTIHRFSQSQRRPLLGPSSGWKCLLEFSHWRNY